MLNHNNNNNINNNNVLGSQYYLQYIGDTNIYTYDSIDDVASALREKIANAKSDNFYGFILSMRKDFAIGQNKFGSKFPTWYTTSLSQAQHFVDYTLPEIQYKLAHYLITDCLTDAQIDEEFSYKEQRDVIKHNKYGAFALR